MTLTSLGCATSARPHRPAAAVAVGSRLSGVVTAPDATLSARDAAAILRRAALLRGLSRSREEEAGGAAQELMAVRNGAWSRPEREALLDLLDRHLPAQRESAHDSTTIDLRVEIARAWLDRGDRARARAQADRVRETPGMVAGDKGERGA